MKTVEFVCGQRGTGKTLYIRSHILAREPRFLVYDHMAEFAKSLECQRVYSVEECLDYLSRNCRGFCRCVLVPLKPSAEEFRLVCRIPFAYQDLLFVCDEIDQWAGAVRPWPPEEFRRLIHFGRHARCGFVGAARRPADVSRAFTSQARRYTLFRQTEPSDLRFLRSVLGPRAEEAKDLPFLHYLAWEDGKWKKGMVCP